MSLEISSVNRYYDPSTDQFINVDPDLARTGQPYAFAGDDPMNQTDPLGLNPANPCSWFGVCHKVHKIVKKLTGVVHRKGYLYTSLELASFVPYTAYYGAYEGLKWTKEPHPLNIAVGIITLPLQPAAIAVEAGGLGGDAELDVLKDAALDNGEGVNDEGFTGPLLGDQTGLGGPNLYLPGIHKDWSVDFEP